MIYLKKFSKTEENEEFVPARHIIDCAHQLADGWRKISLDTFYTKFASKPAPAYLRFLSVTISTMRPWKKYIIDKKEFFQLFENVASAFVDTRLHLDFSADLFEKSEVLLEYLDATLLPLFKRFQVFDLWGLAEFFFDVEKGLVSNLFYFPRWIPPSLFWLGYILPI